MTPILWIGVFVVSLAALVKGSDWVLDGAKKIGLWLGLSPFVVGVLIVGFGTSAPELVSSIAGVLQGATEIPVANAIGSNIANVLLIVGLATLMVRKALSISTNIVDVEIPLFILSTALLIGVAYDGVVTVPESILLLLGFLVYTLYNLFHVDDSETVRASRAAKADRKPPAAVDIALFIVGFVFLIAGANYLIQSVIALSAALNIAVGVITILAVAIGTSLPEFFVSIKAAFTGDTDLSIGNIFGSNTFNALVVVGIPGLIDTLKLDAPTLSIGLPTFAVVSLIFAFSGLSRKIHVWEGAFFILIYILFAAKLFGLF